MLTGEINNLLHLRLRDLVGINATDSNAALVNVHHDVGGLIPVLSEEPLEKMDDEFHWRVIVVQHQNLIHGRPLCLRPALDDNARSLSIVAFRRLRCHGFTDGAPFLFIHRLT